MRHRNPQDRRCTYLVVIERDREPADDLRDLASYLSTLSVAGCEVIVVDGSPVADFREATAPSFAGYRGMSRRGRGIATSPAASMPSARPSTSAVATRSSSPTRTSATTPMPSKASANCSTSTKSSSRRTTSSRCRGGAGSKRDGCSSIAASSRCPITAPRSESASRRCADCAASTSGLVERRGFRPPPRLAGRRSLLRVRRLRPPPAAALDHWLRDRPRQADGDFAMPVQDRFLLRAAAGGDRPGHARRHPSRGRLRGRDRVRIDGAGDRAAGRSVGVLPASRVPLRAAVGFRTIPQRLLGALPQTAKLVDRRGTSRGRRTRRRRKGGER